MRIEKTNESLVIHVDLTDAPSLQMSSGVAYYTFGPKSAMVSVVNGKLDSIVLRHDHSMYRVFQADDVNIPNWVREMVIEILADREVEWLEASDRANEYIIERLDADYNVVMSVAMVDPREVTNFLRTKRDKFQPSDFLVSRTNKVGGTVAGDLWLLRHSSKAAV